MLIQRAAIAGLLCASALTTSGAQASGASSGRVDVTVTVAGTGIALANSVVEITSLHRLVLTSSEGRVVLADVAAGSYRIAVRHIGYTPRDTTVTVAGGDVVLTVGLAHLAVQLAGLITKSDAACVKTGLPDTRDATTEGLLTVLQQVALNAAQQRLLVDQYPFTYTYERTTSPLGVDPASVRMQVDTLHASGAPTWAYQPGEVYQLQPPIRGTQWRTVLHQPTFLTVAEPAFQSSHCFAYSGVEDDVGGRRIRVDFRPATALRGADVEGSIFLDTATYEITRAVVRFTNLDRVPRAALTAVVATSYFEETAPSVSVATLVETQSLLKPELRIGKTGDQSSGRVMGFSFAHGVPAGLVPRWQPDFAAYLAITPPDPGAAAPPPSVRRDSVSAPSRCVAPSRMGVPGIVGTVRETGGAPLPYAVMTLEGGYLAQAVANRDGCFYMQLAQDKPYTLIARRIGFKPARMQITVSADSAAVADVHLDPIAEVLGGVTTVAPRDQGLEETGFYDRLHDRKLGLGSATFFTPEEIENRFDQVTDIVAGASGVHLQVVNGRHVRLLGGSAAGTCPMELWLDGARVSGIAVSSAGFGGRGGGGSAPAAPSETFLDDLVSTNNVSGIEVYTQAAQVPPQFQSVANGCGAVVVWTKR